MYTRVYIYMSIHIYLNDKMIENVNHKSSCFVDRNLDLAYSK